MKERTSNITISENVTYAKMTHNHKTYINPNYTKEDYRTNILKSMTVIESNKGSSNQVLFALIFGWRILFGITGFPTIGMIDQIVMQRVSDYEKETSYGIQRLFAPVGYTVGTFLTGAMLDLYKSNPFLSKYTAIFFCGTTFGVIIIISVYFIKTRTTNPETSQKILCAFYTKHCYKILEN